MSAIDDVVSGTVKLPMVPRVVMTVLAMIRQGDCDVWKVAEEIEQEPVLSSRVLRLANSSFFSGRRSVGSIEEAVSIIGLRALETLVIASGTISAFTDVPGVSLRQFWLCASVTAASSRQLARRLGVPAESAYTAGLLQSVGHLILCQCEPARAEALAGASAHWGAELAAAEQEAFGCTHPAMSALWADHMGLPRDMVDAIARSLDPMDAPATTRLARVLRLATAVGGSVAFGEDIECAAARVAHNLAGTLDLGDYFATESFQNDFFELQSVPSVL